MLATPNLLIKVKGPTNLMIGPSLTVLMIYPRGIKVVHWVSGDVLALLFVLPMVPTSILVLVARSLRLTWISLAVQISFFQYLQLCTEHPILDIVVSPPDLFTTYDSRI